MKEFWISSAVAQLACSITGSDIGPVDRIPGWGRQNNLTTRLALNNIRISDHHPSLHSKTLEIQVNVTVRSFYISS